MSRYDTYISTYGKEVFDIIQSSRILVVGAGGIGCELLKNLVLSGFKTIEIIDLDTIDVSNLNRQFLFRPEHVGQPKSTVAAEAAMQFNPDVTVISHYGNIKDDKFGVNFFEKFSIVLNALDNVEARRHVNRLCLAAKIPLIDSGTTGYTGQVNPIFKGKTSCYDCKPKEAPKNYPICTIRSTPDKPVHCIVWAKECFKLIFGNMTESVLYEDDKATEDISCYMNFLPINEKSNTADATIEHAKLLLKGLFHDDVKKRIDMDVYKNAKTKPTPTSLQIFEEAFSIASSDKDSRPSKQKDWDTNMWNDVECAVELILCVYDIAKEGMSSFGTYAFDKDDSLAMRFVSAASNLRSRIFGIETKNFHDAKGIAGNIIPAIAATNAIVAALQVMQAIKVLQYNDYENLPTEYITKRCPATYVLRSATRRGHYLEPTSPEEPATQCYVCNASQISLQIDIHETNLEEFIKVVLKGKLAFNQPSIYIGSNTIYEEGEDAEVGLLQNLTKKLSDCPAGGIQDGSVVRVEDYTQDLEVEIIVRHLPSADLADEKENTEKFVINGQASTKRKTSSTEEDDNNEGPSLKKTKVDNNDIINDDDDDVMVIL